MIQTVKKDLDYLDKSLPEKVDAVVDGGILAQRVGELSTAMRKRMDILEARQKKEAKDMIQS